MMFEELVLARVAAQVAAMGKSDDLRLFHICDANRRFLFTA